MKTHQIALLDAVTHLVTVAAALATTANAFFRVGIEIQSLLLMYINGVTNYLVNHLIQTKI